MLPPRLRPLLWAAGVVVGISAEWVAFDWSQPHLWVPDLVVGWAFIGCGLVVAARHTGRRSGILMVVTGFAWFLGNFAAAPPGFLASLAAIGTYIHRGPLVHLILAYPSGRIASTLARAVVAVAYAAGAWSPIWDNEVATILLALLVVAVAAVEYVRSVGRRRPARLLALGAAAAFAGVLVGGAAARLALPAGEVSYGALLAYQATLCAIAGGLTAGLVTTIWERTDIADLVVELGAGKPGTLRTALARALGDPSLEISYWMPEAESFVDSDGRLLSLPNRASGRSVTLVERGGEPVAALVHHPAVLDDPALLEAVTSAAQLAASNVRLRAEVQARVVQVEASRRRILAARDDERRRLERRLHDGAEQRLEHLRQTLNRGLAAASGVTTIEQLTKADAQLARTIEELRQLARGLHPRTLTEQGLQAAVSSLAAGFPVPLDISVTTQRIPPEIAAAAYFTCAEALANIAKHASASKAGVSVRSDGSILVVAIEDDGVGGAKAAGSGLRGLADRLGTLGATLRVENPKGGGTRVIAEIPLGDDPI